MTTKILTHDRDSGLTTETLTLHAEGLGTVTSSEVTISEDHASAHGVVAASLELDGRDCPQRKDPVLRATIHAAVRRGDVHLLTRVLG